MSDVAGSQILIVEDDYQLARVLATALTRLHANVVSVSGASEALQLLRTRSMDLLVTDLNLPGRSGIELLASVRREHPLLPVILITGSQEPAPVVDALNAGADRYLMKPFDLKQFESHVTQAIAIGRARIEAESGLRQLQSRLKERDAEVQSLVIRGISALVQAVEAKDAYTHGHASRVASYAIILAKALKFEDAEAIRLGGQLHDIGKIGVPDAVLNKSGPLDEEEFHAIKQHPLIGRNILSSLIDNPHILSIAYSHHERWDGTGYPDRLKSHEIPVPARIVAVADVLDAITSSRSYRAAKLWDTAVAEITTASGRQFDPDVVAVFVECLPELMATERAFDLKRATIGVHIV